MRYQKKANLHIHTLTSDGIYTTKKILKEAKRRDVDIISITDHNAIKGSLKACKLASDFDITVIPGIEIYFRMNGKQYEILAYFKTPEILTAFYRELRCGKTLTPHFSKVEDLCAMVEKHDGVIIVPHLFSYKGLFRDGVKGSFSAVERVSSHKGSWHNKKSLNFLEGKEFIQFGSSDLHVYKSDLSAYYTLLESFEEIDLDAIWANLRKEKETIIFIPIDKQMTYHKIYFQSLVRMAIPLIPFLLKQFYIGMKHRVAYYKLSEH